MGRFIFDITDEQRVRLESYRARNGLRSLADALRHMINGSPPSQLVAIKSGTPADFDAAQRAPGIANALAEALPTTYPTKAAMSVVGGGAEVIHRLDDPAPMANVQVGPTRAAPGERLKRRK